MRRSWLRGTRVVLLLGALALALTGCSVQSAEKKLRFGWPSGVTKQAAQMRTLWTWAGVLALFIGALVWTAIFWCMIRYRKKSDELPRQFKTSLLVEVLGVTVPVLIIAGLFYRTVVVEDYANKLSKNPDVLIQLDGFKWNWQFEYHTYHGQTTDYAGKQSPTTPGQPFYVSTVGSDTEIPVLVIPRGETVQFIEHSDDVVHSFWVPEFLFKRDVIPYGTLSTTHDNRFEITAVSNGSYVGRCAELCGTYHSQMNFEVRVVDPSVYQAYIAALQQIGPDDPARQSKALTQAHVPGGPVATTTHPFGDERASN